MRAGAALAGALLSIGVPASWALNPIHDAAAEFAPGLLGNLSQPSLLLGEYYTQESGQKIRVPMAYLHPLNPQFQVAAGAQTRWLEEPNNIRHLTAGLRYAPTANLSFQTDFLWGVANYAGDGLTLSGNVLLRPLEILQVLGTARAGFFDALVWHPDLAVLSLGVTPRLMLHENFRLELEAFSALQVPGISDYFSFDLGPAIWVRIGYGFALKAGAVFGLLGPNRASPRFQLAQRIAL
jgi:hypothetical protein